jgi:hypothetical protein
LSDQIIVDPHTYALDGTGDIRIVVSRILDIYVASPRVASGTEACDLYDIVEVEVFYWESSPTDLYFSNFAILLKIVFKDASV